VTGRELTPDSKFLLEEGASLLSGIKALVRLPLGHDRGDRRAGFRTATLITGYRGSPLPGLELALQKTQPFPDALMPVQTPGNAQEVLGRLGFELDAKPFRANGLNRLRISTLSDRVGIAAVGKTYLDLREALRHPHLPGPDAPLLDPETARQIGRGLEEVVVIEEKRPFLELFRKDALEAAVRIAELADGIRGYEDVKRRNVETFVGKMEAT
jgi:TPP-dependent indolepyruvate ferredoxin oxidoreductase alpha subunit